MAFTLTSAEVPLPVVNTTLEPLIDAYVTDPSGGEGPDVAYDFAAGSTVLAAKLNSNFKMLELLGKYGAGVYCVITGLTFTSSGLNLTVANGQAIIDGIVEINSNSSATIALPANKTRVHIYLKQDGTLTYQSETLTHPVGKCVYLGSCVTGASTISTIDYSGVLYARGSLVVRNTADTGYPADTPSSSICFLAKTAGGTYLWNGDAYVQTATQAQLTELVQDIVGALLSGSDGLAFVYTDATPSLVGTVNTTALPRLGYPYNVESISATKSLALSDKNIQVLTASGGNRDVRMPPVASLTPDYWFRILNAGSSNNIVIKDETGVVTIATLTPGDSRTITPKYSSGTIGWPSTDPGTI